MNKKTKYKENMLVRDKLDDTSTSRGISKHILISERVAKLVEYLRVTLTTISSH